MDHLRSIADSIAQVWLEANEPESCSPLPDGKTVTSERWGWPSVYLAKTRAVRWLDGTTARLLVFQFADDHPRLPRRREARGSEPSIGHPFAKLLGPVLDQDQLGVRSHDSDPQHHESLIVGAHVVHRTAVTV